MGQMEKQANTFDCDLYRLLNRAKANADAAPVGSGLRQKWVKVALHLIDARAPVREMMNARDRAATS